MNDVQRSLVNPQDYQAPIDRQQLLAEVKAGKHGQLGHEVGPFVQSAITDTNKDGPLSLEAVVKARESMRTALSGSYDRCYAEFGKLSFCADDMLVRILVDRANSLAKSVIPGAQEHLGQAVQQKR